MQTLTEKPPPTGLYKMVNMFFDHLDAFQLSFVTIGKLVSNAKNVSFK